MLEGKRICIESLKQLEMYVWFSLGKKKKTKHKKSFYGWLCYNVMDFPHFVVQTSLPSIELNL